MKQLFLGFALMLSLAMLAGCGGFSSTDEATAAVQRFQDCKEVVQVISVSGPFYSRNITVDTSIPALTGKEGAFSHVVVYRTKSNGLKIATLDGQRPPQTIMLSQEFK